MGAGAVAAPVLDGSQQIVAAISVVYPLHVVTPDLKNQMALYTQEAANQISAELGLPL